MLKQIGLVALAVLATFATTASAATPKSVRHAIQRDAMKDSTYKTLMRPGLRITTAGPKKFSATVTAIEYNWTPVGRAGHMKLVGSRVVKMSAQFSRRANSSIKRLGQWAEYQYSEGGDF